ncbi:MAG: oligosaccharide flippase family protein [Siphonobacter sp.]
MGIVIRQSLKASAATYVGMALGVVNSLFVSTYFLEPNQVGLTNSLVNFSILFASFASLGVSGITDRYLGRFRNDAEGHHGFMAFIFTYATFGFVLFYISFEALRPLYHSLFRDKSPELIQYEDYIIPLTGGILLQTVFEAWCRNHQRIAIPALLREVLLRVLNISSVLLYGFQIVDFSTFLVLYVGQYFILDLTLLLYTRQLGRFYWRPNWKALDRKIFREIVTYGLFLIMGAVGVNLCTYIDRILLSSLVGQTETGIFSIAAIIAILIEIPKKSISQISIPILAQAMREEKWELVETMHKKAALNQLLIGSFLFLGIWCNIDDVFSLMAKGDEYRPGKYAVLFLGLSKLIDMGTGLSNEIIGYSRYYRINLPLILLLGVITLGTGLWLIPRFEVTGAAAATAITILAYSAVRGLYVVWRFKITPFTLRTLGAIAVGLIAYGATSLVPDFGTDFLTITLTIVLRGIITTIVFGLLVISFRISPDVNQLITTLWNQVKGFMKR